MIRRPRAFLFRRRAVYGAVLASLFFFSLAAHAAPLELDLGQGLGYFRVHALPADLPPASAKSRPLVLDLRFSTANDSAANALEAWIKFRATAATPVLVLVNADTPAAFHSVLASLKAQPGFLTLGAATPDFTPDLAVETDAEVERRAYDALEHGASVDSLTRQNADKPRNDEASLMHERENPVDDFADDPLNDLTDHDEPPVRTPSAPPPLIDVALQRAIQLHRALLALKRL
jgi:hypothetical protein